MITKKEIINLPEGEHSVTATIFEEKDDIILSKLYRDWVDLSTNLRSLGGRGVNLPDVLSEGIFCRATGSIRINTSIAGANSSFDVYNLKSKKRIQVKACSVLPDLTSFGPNSVWDEIYFMDFYSNGKWDGEINIYLIPNELIYSQKVNANSTLKEQQLLGRRPRFSIYNGIILLHKLSPIITYKLDLKK